MKTIREECKAVGSSAYWGERGDWIIAQAIHRDSGCLERSNFEVFHAVLKALPAVKEWTGEYNPVAVERFSHWAVGWVDYLLINPECKEAVMLAEILIKKLDEEYPVLDEEDYSRKEQEEAEQVWRDCYRERERVEYIRNHRSQFEFRGFADLLGCVRGKYFAGYASELIS